MTGVELPDPGAPGKGEIRVRLHASSLNYHDYRVMSVPGSHRRRAHSDVGRGGVVEEVGAGVTAFRTGDHVVSCFFPGWIAGEPYLPDFATVPGDGVDGYAREAVVVPGRSLHPRAARLVPCGGGDHHDGGADRVAGADRAWASEGG